MAPVQTPGPTAGSYRRHSQRLGATEREGCPFLTADDKLVKNLQGRFPFIVPLASLP